LALVSASAKGAINTQTIGISPDGRKLAVAGAGIDEGGRRAYVIPIYDARNLDNMVGQVDVQGGSANIAFHPVLKIGVAEKMYGQLVVFKTTSLARAQMLKLPKDVVPQGAVLTFGARGRNIVFATHSGHPGGWKDSQLYLLPLELTA